MRNEALVNSGRSPIFTAAEIQDMYANGDCEPFVRQAMQTALQQNYNVSVSGGTKHTTYMVSDGYFDQGSNYIGPDYGKQRYNVRSNITTEWGRFKVGANVNYTRAETKQPTTSGFLLLTSRVSLPIISSVLWMTMACSMPTTTNTADAVQSLLVL